MFFFLLKSHDGGIGYGQFMFMLICRAILENIVEFQPEMSKDIAEAGFMAWLIKKLKVNMGFSLKKSVK